MLKNSSKYGYNNHPIAVIKNEICIFFANSVNVVYI